MRSWTQTVSLWVALLTLAVMAAPAKGQTSNALVRVCPSTATGTPCMPLASVYSDAALTHPVANPYSASPASSYSLYVAPGNYTFQVTGAAPNALAGQSISGQVVNGSTGKAVAFGKIRVCAYDSSGLPCSPLATIYSDPALTQQVPNPYTTDQNGNYSLFGQAGYYIVQVQVASDTVYSYAKGYSGFSVAAGTAGAIQYSSPGGTLGGISLNGIVVGVPGASPRVAIPTDITPLLALFSNTSVGAVPISPGGTNNYLQSDGTWSTSLKPTSVGGSIFADSLGSSDVGVNVKSGWARVTGTSSSAARSADMNLTPGTVYYTSSQVLIAPDQSSNPYIRAPQFDCHGSTIVSNYTGTDGAFLVLGQNANNSAADSGYLKNCDLVRANSFGPVLQNQGRLGYHIFDTTLEHSDASAGIALYDVLLTNAGSGVGYTEQTYLHNVAYDCSYAGGQDQAIYVHNGAGSDGGHLYNTYEKERFQDCRYGFHIGPGVNAFGLKFEYQQNNGLAGNTYAFYNEGTVLSSYLLDNGETTGAGTIVNYASAPNMVADFATCIGLARVFRMTSNFTCNAGRAFAGTGAGIYGQMQGLIETTIESSFGNGARANTVYANGDYLSHIHSGADVAGGHGTTEIVSCPPSADGKPYDSPRSSCDNIMVVRGDGSTPSNPYGETVAFGPGFFGDSQGSDIPSASENIDMNAARGFRMHPIGNPGTYQTWKWDPATNEFVQRVTVPVSYPGQAQVNGWRLELYNAAAGVPYTKAIHCYYNGTTADCAFSGMVSATSLSTSQTPVASTTASDHSIPIVLNGTLYYMRLSTTP